MQVADNIQTIKDIYAAFGRGDIQSVLNGMSDDVQWKPIIGAGPHVPHAGARRGKASVQEFFTIVGHALTFDQFEPREFVAQDDKVVALGHYRATTSARKQFESDWAMVFTLRNGKVTDFREFTDSSAVDRAY